MLMAMRRLAYGMLCEAAASAAAWPLYHGAQRAEGRWAARRNAAAGEGQR
jgi:hypothetical protein